MKNNLLFLFVILFSSVSFSQGDCFKKLEDAFTKRGSLSIADAVHENVIISFFETGKETRCISGKARVENGTIISVFLQREDNGYDLYDETPKNSKKSAPIITNGITEMAITPDGEKYRVVFYAKLKPKKANYKSINLPDDL
jgi:hypothetical protein